MKPVTPRGNLPSKSGSNVRAIDPNATSAEPISTKHLLEWRAAVQTEITEQCGLRTKSSPYFRADILREQTDRELEINTELKKRGILPDFTPFTDPSVARKQESIWQ